MNNTAIAIVGMAGRFPGAGNIAEFWRNLRDGVESIRVRSDEELLAAGVSSDDLARSDYVKAAAVLNGIDMWDASFFGFSPKDAAIMDPQHRHFLECAWEALESAGHVPEVFAGSVGVFAGSGMNAYMIHNLLKNSRLLNSVGLFLIKQTGNDKDVLATRVSYQYDLRGPSLNIQTACSTSLVAVHVACQSLLNCECDMALAGGVTIEVPHGQGYVYREGEILSRDGHCRSFDASSSGTVFSSGVGIVVLRRLEDAIKDHDTIHAVIVGSAINNDGQRKAGYLAPSVVGQAEVIAEALGIAGVSADSISYVETHGTGTTVGDPIEIKGLTQAFRKDTNRNSYCAIGSLKTNVGHLDAAAGVAGLIKTTLALRHKQLPASLNYKSANPQIDFPNTPFYVNTSLAEWKANESPRRAGVTALGIGGTNAHVVLEEAPDPIRQKPSHGIQIIPLSARSETALQAMGARLATHLNENPQLELADVAFTCQLGRKTFPQRRFVVAGSLPEATQILSSPWTRRLSDTSEVPKAKSVVFMFSGQGSQYLNMGADLYSSEKIFHDCLDLCAGHLLPLLGLDLRKILFPSPEQADAAVDRLNSTEITQPALFSLEYSLAQWWMAHGIQPRSMVGHSIGEYVAACIAGVFSLKDALAITALRGRLMQRCEPGSMLAVALAPEELSLVEGISLAAVNSPGQSVVSGPTNAIVEFEKQLLKQDVFCSRLRTSHAFHSSMMDPILDDFKAQMRSAALEAPRIPFLSNLTGTWITAAEATDPEYWALHLRNTVKFSDCVTELLDQDDRVMLEVGPGQTLSSLVKQHAGGKMKALSSIRRREEEVNDVAFLLNSLGQLWVDGQAVNWSARHNGCSPMRVPLPTYPFERQRYWIDPDKANPPNSAIPSKGSALGASSNSHEANSRNKTNQSAEATNPSFFKRQWSRTEQPTADSLDTICWLIFLDSVGLGKQITVQLRGAGHEVIEVSPGATFKRVGRGDYTLRPGDRADYDALFADLNRRKNYPKKIIHLWSIGDESSRPTLDEKLMMSFYSLLVLAQSLGDQDDLVMDIAVVSNRLHSVSGETTLDPVSATLLGPTRVIPKEYPGITCRNIDVDLTSHGAGLVAVQVITEHCTHFINPVVAFRDGVRWIENIEQFELPTNSDRNVFRQQGVYLITGGLGDLGLVIAEELARNFHARLILTGRSSFPPIEQWKSLFEATDTPERLRQQIGQLLDIQKLGSEVHIVSGDIAQADAVKHIIDDALAKFGTINGVVHAAGVLDDGPLQLKSQESAARVLEPKVRGTLVLHDALREALKGEHHASLDFFALFSSVSSVMAPAGQVDYVAANSFLDAYSTNQGKEGMVSINWGPWRDVGMAARISSSHPLLGRRLLNTADEISYAVPLGHDQNWVLAEHCLNSGPALLPGTSYLEMASAALARGSSDQGVVFEDVFFLSPFMTEPGETREAQVHLQRSSKGSFQFSVRARDTGSTEYATGQIAQSKLPPPSDVNMKQIAARCQSRVITFDEGHRTEQEKFFRFGPRWRNLKTIHIGVNEALTHLELHSQYSDDTLSYRLHPALLDLATGAALYLIQDYDRSRSIYFPLSYKRATFYRPLTSTLHSLIRNRQKNIAGQDVVTFDITLLDELGKVLAEIQEFSMRLVLDPQQTLETVPHRNQAHTASNRADNPGESRGISSADGALAFTRVLSSRAPSGVLVLPAGLTSLSLPDATAVKSISTESVSADEVELLLAEWWQEMLGVDRVDLDDDFFDLGGHSLIVVRLFSQIKKTYGINFGLSTLFEARTVRKLSQLIRESRTATQTTPKSGPALVPIQPKGTQPPLYVVSGLGGNVIKFHSMAFYLGEDQPVYGLLPRGLDGREAYHTRVEDMAAYYVEAIRAVQAKGPYHLVGYSFGGAVAYEVAQQLIAAGGEVGLMGLFDTIEWSYMVQVEKSLSTRERLAVYKSQLSNEASGENPFRSINRRLKAKASKTIYRIFSALGRPVPQVVGSLEDVNAFAGANYHPKPYPGTLTLFRATNRGPLDGNEEFLGWKDLAEGGIDVHHVPGTHLNLLQEPGVKVLSEKLKECLSSFFDSKSTSAETEPAETR